MDEISVADVQQLYVGSLCLYKGEPVKFLDILGDYTATIKSIKLGRTFNVKFTMKEFSAPMGRIGYVNHGNLAFYVTRKTSRQWCAGVNSRNTTVEAPMLECKQSKLLLVREVSQFEGKCIHNALKNIYPKFNEALKQAIEHEGMYAFDKQFAVDYKRRIHYRRQIVGFIPEGKDKTEDIIFNNGWDYLQLPLLQEYEKTVRTFGFA